MSAPILTHQSGSWTCHKVWNGHDFTHCFQSRRRYLQNYPIFLVIASTLWLATRYASKCSMKSPPSSPLSSVSTLQTTTMSPEFSSLESAVILDSLATNLLPPHLASNPSTTEEPLDERSAEDFIRDWRSRRTRIEEFWMDVRFWVGVVGGIVWFEIEIAKAAKEGAWLELIFPGWIALLAALHQPIIPVLTLHLPIKLLLFRSSVIQQSASALTATCIAAELFYWFALISIPYEHELDRLLEGGTSKGGGTLGSFGHSLPSHPEESSSPFSRATYTFLLPLLFKHYKKPITVADIPGIREDDSSAAALAAFRAYQATLDKRYRKKYGQDRKRDLGIDLLWFFAPELSVQAGWSIICIVFEYLPPTGLRLLLEYVNSRAKKPQSSGVAVLYVAMMAIGQCFSAMAMGQCLLLGRRLCIRLRAIIVAELFAKSLRRSDVSGKTTNRDANGSKEGRDEGSASEGKINNLVSVDAFTISEICAYIFYLFSCPLAVIVNCALLYMALGAASFAGIAVLVLLMPLQGLIGKLYTRYQSAFMAATDKRLESVTEVIAYIKLIKINAWEGKFYERMDKTRKAELHALGYRFMVTILFQLFVWGTPVLVTGVAFAVHSLVLRQHLSADRAFASLVLFNMMKDPLALFQNTFTRLLQAYTSCRRIQEYLEEPDTLKYQQISKPGPGDPQIGFKGAILTYAPRENIQESGSENDLFAVGELNIEFPVGALSVISGHVGSGKTTLVQGLLGECALFQGQTFMPDNHGDRATCPIDPAPFLSETIAYCAQTPWLMATSIRDNIVFGAKWNASRYRAVVDACALRRDFDMFEQGDDTEVGEKGTTCSGGQKARIALARAIYSSAKIVILDDVLSAVDAQTARHLYENVLQGPLIRGRTVIMVTHQVELVANAAQLVIVLEEGTVIGQGSVDDLVAEGFLNFDKEESNNSVANETHVDDTISKSGQTLVANDAPTVQAHLQNNDVTLVVEPEAVTPSTTPHGQIQDKVDQVKEQAQHKLIEAESQAHGITNLSTYLLYFRSMGGLVFWVLVVSAFVGSNALQVGSNAWVKRWANADDEAAVSSLMTDSPAQYVVSSTTSQPSDRFSQPARHSTMYYLTIYWGISLIYLLAVAARVGITFAGALDASKRIYDRLLNRILGARMRFFDCTPSGRIMNRLSKDMSAIDQEAGEILMYFANCCLSAVTVLVVVSIATPAFIAALVLILFLYWIIGSLYVTTNREIKRIDSVTRSPILISFSEVLVGMSTIRSYGDSARFLRKIFHELDQNTRCFWYMWQTNLVLHIFSNLVGALVTIFAAIFSLRNPTMDAGAVGLSISYALSFTEYILWVVRMYASSEMSMNSVERVGEYLKLEVEEEEEDKSVEPPAYWPSRDGSVIIQNLTCSYAPQLDPVLKDVSFIIGPREKIGVCGRTGCGKSTLALSFFRFLHQSGGQIIIDGQDIQQLSLATLRSRLTILPQEAQLFSGSIRDNLDPFHQHEDCEIWDALSQCGMVTRSRAPSRSHSRRQSRLSPRASVGALRDTHAGVETAVRAVKKQRSSRSLLKRASKKLEVMQEEWDDEDEEEDMVVIKSLEEGVAAGGKNFSQGQRQLLALARGLLKLKSSSFLIMDESTANLDQETDATIQDVLRTSLGDTQMLVIAHRLMTVCGLDKILVLDSGRVVEFGTPWELLQKGGEEAVFKGLCKQSGNERELYELAQSIHESKHGNT
ncbi:hypothetical protein IAR50_004781 [Cryptococcus sp. DSM 104548]